jgi:lysozyme
MKYQDRIVKEITSREGTELKAYWDADGKIWTIGKGTTKYLDGTSVKQGDVITQEEANSLLVHYIDTRIAPILDKLDLTENEYCALASLAYNTGEGILFDKQYALARALQAKPNPSDMIERRKALIAVEIMQWIMSNGRPILRGRRLEEAREFLGGA